MRTPEEIYTDMKKAKDELLAIDTKRYGLALKVRDLETEYAECLSPFKIGQRVIEDYGIQKIEYEISSIGFIYGTSVEHYGRKVLKDGGLHKNQTRLYGKLTTKKGEQS